MTSPRLALTGIVKRYGTVLAVNDVSLSIAPGERHGLIGENGAGKSTLVKTICGLVRPDAGEIVVDGKAVAIADPRAARALGIGIVFQHFALFDAMTVGENIALGLDDGSTPRDVARRIGEVAATYGLALDPARRVASLSVGERQRIEIVRCLMAKPRLLVMDEPTSVLTEQEVGRLFLTLRRLSQEGCAILYISHKLGEVEALCERATVLRGGRVVARLDPREAGAAGMAEQMIGAAPTRRRREAGMRPEGGAPRLGVQGLSLHEPGAARPVLDAVTFEVRAGEILGIAGVAGNGQGPFLDALSGERLAREAAAVMLDGKPVGRLGPRTRRRLGLCALPEERNGHAAVPALPLAANALVTARDRLRLVRGAAVRWRATTAYAEDVIARFGVKTAGSGALASSLSGGNLQKFCVGREIGQAPDVFVVSQPTWGVDAGAAAAIHGELLALSARGAAIVIISQDLDELFALADTIRVLDAGRLSRPLDPARTSAQEIGLLMGGVYGETPAPLDAAA